MNGHAARGLRSPSRRACLFAATLALILPAWGPVATAAPPDFILDLDDEEFNGPLPGWANARDARHAGGALGDGVADDTAALQAAIDDLGRRVVFGNDAWYPSYRILGSPAVLYLPPGTYRITRTLVITQRSGVSIVGADPATTRILWDGPAGGTMLVVDGNLHGSFRRLTWDGNGRGGSAKRAGIAVAHWWNSYKHMPGQAHGGSSSHVDEVFTDVDYGIVGGCCQDAPAGAANAGIPGRHPGVFVDANDRRRIDRTRYRTLRGLWSYADYGNLDSENLVLRSRFVRNRVAGVKLESFNAMNWWIFDASFEDCGRGVSNSPGAGSFAVHRSVFLRSTDADVVIANLGPWFSLHENVSVGSNRFLMAAEIGWGAPVIVRGNRVVDTVQPDAIFQGNLGPLILIDNAFRSRPGASGPVVRQMGWESGRDIFSVGNRFTVPEADRMSMRYDDTRAGDVPRPAPLPNRVRSIGDRTIAANGIPAQVPARSVAPSLVNRRVFPVTVTSHRVRNDPTSGAPLDLPFDTPVSTGAAVQQAIDAAVAAIIRDQADNPIVYLPPAVYTVTSPIVVPARVRLQIVGDGWLTSLETFGTVPEAIRLQGPSFATVRNLSISNGGQGAAIRVLAADQPGGRIVIRGSQAAGLGVSGLLETRLLLWANTGVGAAEPTSQSNAGEPNNVVTNSGSVLSVGASGWGATRVSGNSRVMLMDNYYEGAERTLYRATAGEFSLVGARIAPYEGTPQGVDLTAPAVLLDGFSGRFAMIGTELFLPAPVNGVSVRNERSVADDGVGTNVLLLGSTSWQDEGSFDRRGKGGVVAYASLKHRARRTPADAAAVQLPLPNNAEGYDDAAVQAGLVPLRRVRWADTPFVPTPGATDLRILGVQAPMGSLQIEGRTLDCLLPDARAVPGGGAAELDLARTGVRAATAAECPSGGRVAVVQSVRRTSVCNAGFLAYFGEQVLGVADSGRPDCNAPGTLGSKN